MAKTCATTTAAMETQVATLPYCCEHPLDAAAERRLAAAAQHVHPCCADRRRQESKQMVVGIIARVVSCEPCWVVLSGEHGDRAVVGAGRIVASETRRPPFRSPGASQEHPLHHHHHHHTLDSVIPRRSDASGRTVRWRRAACLLDVASPKLNGVALPSVRRVAASHTYHDSNVVDMSIRLQNTRTAMCPRMTVSVSIRPSLCCPEPKSDVHAFPPLCNSGTLKTLPCQSCTGFTSALLEVLTRACACLSSMFKGLSEAVHRPQRHLGHPVPSQVNANPPETPPGKASLIGPN